MRKKEDCLHIWQLQHITLYQRRKKIRSLDTIEFLDTHVFINNPHWQSSGIVTFLCIYDTVISDTLVGFFLDAAVRLSQLYEKWRRKKDWATEESTQKNLCEGHHFFDFTRSFLYHFLLPYSFTTFSNWRTCWIALLKIHIAASGNLCYAEKMKISCNLILYLQT